MTAAYDDDKISSRRQENGKNSNDVPVDFTPQKITAIISDKSTSDETRVMSENPEDLAEKTEELSVSDSSLESETVNASITARICVDVENVAANKVAENNCISLRGVGNSLETCLMLRKQKISEEILTDTQESFSSIDVRDSIVYTEMKPTEEAGKICNEKDTLIDTKLYTELITNWSELQLSSNTADIHMITQKKDLNYSLTDQNKSKAIVINSEEILIDNDISSLTSNCNLRQNETKIIPAHEYSSESASTKDTSTQIMNSKEQKGPQNAHRLLGGYDMMAGKKATLEFPEKENFEDSYDPECEMSFHEAIRAGDAKSVEMIMARGVVQNIDEPDWNVSGDPPLLVAATNHRLPVLRALLSNGCDPGVRSPRGETALHRAIINGSPSSVFEIVEELLKHGCPSTVKEAGGGLTALHILTRQLAHAQSSKSLHHNFDIALKTLALLAKVGPVDAKDHQGRSALHLLASSSTFGNSHKIEIEPMIRTLLEAGADPALKNDRGETPLHEALECGALNTAFLLIPHTPIGITSRYGETPLHIAARKNQPEVVDSLLKRGENPSFQDAGGNTPLHLASARGFHHTVSLLVSSPLAQLEKINDEGLTSLQVAAESGFVNAVRLLLKAGADPSQTAHCCVATLHRHPDISVLINHELTRRRQLAA